MTSVSGNSQSLPKTADIVILGAGVMGASIAFHLARRKGGTIVVIDKNHVGRGGSGRSSALIRMHYSFPPEVQLEDSRPLLGEIPGIAGVYVCAGFSGMGFKISPAIGLAMSELVLDGEGKTVDIRAFRPDRFAVNQPINAEFE